MESSILGVIKVSELIKTKWQCTHCLALPCVRICWRNNARFVELEFPRLVDTLKRGKVISKSINLELEVSGWEKRGTSVTIHFSAVV